MRFCFLLLTLLALSFSGGAQSYWYEESVQVTAFEQWAVAPGFIDGETFGDGYFSQPVDYSPPYTPALAPVLATPAPLLSAQLPSGDVLGWSGNQLLPDLGQVCVLGALINWAPPPRLAWMPSLAPAPIRYAPVYDDSTAFVQPRAVPVQTMFWPSTPQWTDRPRRVVHRSHRHRWPKGVVHHYWERPVHQVVGYQPYPRKVLRQQPWRQVQRHTRQVVRHQPRRQMQRHAPRASSSGRRDSGKRGRDRR